MNNPRISIIIPTYNSSSDLRKLLQSFVVSNFQDFEIIINDDQRTSDDTACLVEEFVSKGLRIVYLRENTSIAQARKLGASRANGQYLLHLDSDMRVSPALLGECVALANSGWDALVIPEESFGTTFWADCKALEKKCINGIEQIESLRFVTKSVYTKVGGHNEQMVFSEDKDFDIRVREAGCRVGRTKNIIRHDEGELTLLKTFRKKIKYSMTANIFAEAHPEEFRWQMGILNRYRIYLQHKKYFFTHPFLYIGMFFLKAFEFGFIGGWLVNLSSNFKKKKNKNIEKNVAENLTINPCNNTDERLVTISIPTYNSEKFLGLCLESIKNQGYKNIEINIIDGASKDKTIDIAKGFGVQNIMNYPGGLLEARYRGAKIANGDFVLLLDSDQVLEPDCIEKAVVAMESNDMLVLEESVYRCENFIEKLFYLDRKLVHAVKDFNPMTSVMLPRFYKKDVLLRAFENIPADVRESTGGQDHAIIYLEAWNLSQKIDMVTNAVKHIEPNSLPEIWKKFYRWGKTSVGARSNKYSKMLAEKEKFRKGLFKRGMLKESFASILLLIIKGVPYKLGCVYGNLKK